MKFEEGKIDYSKNKTVLFTTYRSYFYFFLVTALTDAISTSCFMSMLGPGQESNFIVRDLAFYYGIYAGPALGKIYQLFAVWGLSVIAPRLTRLVCIVVIAINLFATGINITVYLQALKDAAAGQ
jgi:hypothetical protein